MEDQNFSRLSFVPDEGPLSSGLLCSGDKSKMRNVRRLVLGLLLLSLAGVGWGENEKPQVHASAAYGDIGISATQDGTWFAFNSVVGARIIYFCRLMPADSDGQKEPICQKVVADSYDKQMEGFGKGSYK